MLALSAYTATTAVGTGCGPLLRALQDGRSGLVPCTFEGNTLPTWIGPVAGLDEVALPDGLVRWDCRNNRLAWLGLQADDFVADVRSAVARHGAERVALIMGTSTSGILATEHAYAQRGPDGTLPDAFDYRTTHNIGSLAGFLREALGLRGPSWVISTACSSSAKAFAAADRLLASGLADAALVGGVDTLCLTTLCGFTSLELASPEPCRPADAGRQGLSIGEAAAFALLQRPEDAPHAQVLLSGWGEASDAWHMSRPHPEGRGARAAMQEALERAALPASAVDYINLHGTATPANDLMEARAITALFGNTVACSSSKGMIGHTLGAAGAVEAVICALMLAHQWLPPSVGTQTPDPQIELPLVLAPRKAGLRHVLSNSFGFGGSNASLLFSRRSA